MGNVIQLRRYFILFTYNNVHILSASAYNLHEATSVLFTTRLFRSPVFVADSRLLFVEKTSYRRVSFADLSLTACEFRYVALEKSRAVPIRYENKAVKQVRGSKENDRNLANIYLQISMQNCRSTRVIHFFFFFTINILDVVAI
ncbi:hypothetical protein PUN28_007295 [Cardiocondyla obscurior]|uniref:Uncharacterized protein n=1 Tax=Cardiocondyla obscurior TaxID=286306 RepID=A0AAW2G481_9HYME